MFHVHVLLYVVALHEWIEDFDFVITQVDKLFNNSDLISIKVSIHIDDVDCCMDVQNFQFSWLPDASQKVFT